MLALVYAILCLLFTAGNDFTFKFFTQKKSPMGGFIMIVGIISTVVALLGHPDFGNPWETLAWGLAAGFFSAMGNLLLVSAMGKLPVGICSTVYRLNMVAVILGGWLIFHENLSALHWCGVTAAFFAVLCFLPPKFQQSPSSEFSYQGFILVLIAMLLRAGLGLVLKGAANAGINGTAVTFYTCLCWILGGPLWYAFIEHQPNSEKMLTRRTVIFGIISGLLVYLIVRCSAEMLVAGGKVSLTLPLAQMSFVLTFVMGIVILKEKFTIRMLLGALGGILAVVLLAISSQMNEKSNETTSIVSEFPHLVAHVSPSNQEKKL